MYSVISVECSQVVTSPLRRVYEFLPHRQQRGIYHGEAVQWARSRVAVKEKVLDSTSQLAKAADTTASGNGTPTNGAVANGAGLNGAMLNGASLNGSSTYTFNSNGATKNGATIAATVATTKNGTESASDSDSDFDVDAWADPGFAGQVETKAAQAGSEPAKSTAEYDVKTPYAQPSGPWAKFKKYTAFKRTIEIWTFVFKFAFKYLLLGQKWTYGRGGMTPQAQSDRKRKLAIWLREGLVRLGPTFIKIGQQFSTRVDVLSPEFIKELEKLQDNVPPFETQYALALIQRELGASVEDLFEEFDERPVAAASLGQVHLCQMNGQKLVCKVQRPGLRELFAIDLKNIRKIAEWLNNVDPKTDGAARDWVAIYDECARILYEEIDYKLEAANAKEFAKNFADVEWIKVPQVYEQYSTREVLVMEYVPGVKVNNAEAIDRMGLDRQRLARLCVESYLQQLLRFGFFHADPHPGNVAVDAGNGGRLIYYDFGMMGRIPNTVREGLFDLFYGVYEKSPDRCLDALVTMGVLVGVGDRTAIRRTAEFFLDQFDKRLQEQRRQRDASPDEYNSTFKKQLTKEEKKAKRKKILANIGEDILVAAADQPFRFPATFTFVVRAFTVLDGIGKSLDPRFDISEISAPYAREFLLEATPVMDRVARDLQKRAANQNRALVNLFRGPNQIAYVSDTLQRIERGDLKLRVRALEAERALARVQTQQKLLTSLVLAAMLANIGTVLQVSALPLYSLASFVGAVLCGFTSLVDYIKLKRAENQEKAITGAA